MALFGEKYGAQVRVVTVPGVEDAGIPTSRELCGGTHVRRTGDIGAFTLVSDSTIASGVRRIEALCGHEALRFFKAKSETLERAAALFQSRPDAVPEQIEKLRAEIERLKKQSDAQQKAGLQAQLAARAKDFPEIGGIRYFVEAFDVAADQKTAREAGDQLRGLLKKGVAIVAFKSTDFVTVTAVATDDFVDQYKFRMDSFIKEIAPRIGGGGGGKPTLAVAGGKDVRQVEAILKETQERIEKLLRDA
jgi:alanyl-tRNA synthetase